jgi:hypothetical protein
MSTVQPIKGRSTKARCALKGCPSAVCQLPVELQGAGVDGQIVGQLAEVDIGHPLGHGRDEVLERPGLAVDVEEDPVVPGLAAHRHEAVARRIEARDMVNLVTAEMGRADELAVEVVGPGMIGAGEQPEAATGPVHGRGGGRRSGKPAPRPSYYAPERRDGPAPA